MIYRVIRNDCRCFNNLPYTTHLRQEYVVATMDQETLKVFFYDVWCAVVMQYYFMLILQYADMLQTVRNELHYRVYVCRITNGAHTEHL
jgi:hypothetical protein